MTERSQTAKGTSKNTAKQAAKKGSRAKFARDFRLSLSLTASDQLALRGEVSEEAGPMFGGRSVIPDRGRRP
jgi:hypothetical protein